MYPAVASAEAGLALSPYHVAHDLVVLPKLSVLRLQRQRAQLQLLHG